MNISDLELRNSYQSPMPRSTEEKGAIRYDADFARILDLIKRNTFSREEISHLMEILNSRVNNELEKQKTSNAVEDTEMVLRTPNIPRTPSEVRQPGIDKTMTDALYEKSDVPVGVSASPIDIARAYMATRTSEGSQDLHNCFPNTERAQQNYEISRKPPLMPSASPKPSICWPGAMVHDRHDYSTPQSQRGRHRLHDFPRTPYSRTILSKSTTKVTQFQADRGHVNTSSPFQHSQTSIYGQVKPSAGTVDFYGSVGPLRRTRNRFASEIRPRGSIFLSSSNETRKIATPQGFGGLSPSVEKKFEHGETSGVSKDLSRDSSSGIGSQAIRQVLEHLDRNKPTPKEKEAELELATEWRRSSPESTDVHNVQNIRSVHFEGLASQKNTDKAGPNIPVEFNISKKSKFLENFMDKGKDETKDADNAKRSSSIFSFMDKGKDETKDADNAKRSSSIFSTSKNIPSANAVLPFGLKGTSGPLVKSPNENILSNSNHGQTDTSSQFSRPRLSNGQDEKVEVSKNHGTKPPLASILINKPDLRADNGPGFTFPTSAPSGVYSEPPTPSIMPLSAGIPSHPADMAGVPSYTFGTKRSAQSLVFSFPSSTSDSTHDASDLKFSFGSDKKNRMSFSSFGEDAICY